MKQLWAPWRSAYIDSPKDGPCVFCRDEKQDQKASLILFSGAFSSVMLNKYPYNNAHLLLSPIRHAAGLVDLNIEESIDILRLLRHCTTALTKAVNPDGFNIGMNLGSAAGAGIADHLHMHIVPRWNGDTNFMPVLTDVKVMPAHLEETFDLLKPFFERI
ncbi:MAG: HIT domain-containing protein [Deltaproteobacteria bacterium]|nr:HIT domain-containing protein [Deltaproteobacteria bacterium]